MNIAKRTQFGVWEISELEGVVPTIQTFDRAKCHRVSRHGHSIMVLGGDGVLATGALRHFQIIEEEYEIV